MNNLTNNKRPLEGKDHTSSKNQRVTKFDLFLKFVRKLPLEALFIDNLVAKIERGEPIRVPNDGGDDVGFFAGTGKPRISPTFGECLWAKKTEIYKVYREFCAARNFGTVNGYYLYINE